MPDSTNSHLVQRGTKEGNYRLKEVNKSAKKIYLFVSKMGIF